MAVAQTSRARFSARSTGYDPLLPSAQTSVNKRDTGCLKTSWPWLRHHCDQFTSSSASLRSTPVSLLSQPATSKQGALVLSSRLSGKPSARSQPLTLCCAFERASVFPQLLPLEAKCHLATVLLARQRYFCGVVADLFLEAAKSALEPLVIVSHLVFHVSQQAL